MDKTRRDFVRGIAGTAVAGGLLCLKCKGARAGEAPSGPENLVAACGLYCGACPIYLDSQSKSDQKTREFMQQLGAKPPEIRREDLQCDGCLGKGRLISFCAKCDIRACAAGKSIDRCSDCREFPCSRITRFNDEHGKLEHHGEVLANLRRMREMGIAGWARFERERWQCPRCLSRMSWYDRACSQCGEKRSDRLFPLGPA